MTDPTPEPRDDVRRLHRRHQSAKYMADAYWMLVSAELCNPDRENRLALDALIAGATRATLTQGAISRELDRALVENER